jgi:hypothetical protein
MHRCASAVQKCVSHRGMQPHCLTVGGCTESMPSGHRDRLDPALHTTAGTPVAADTLGGCSSKAKLHDQPV